MKKDVRYYDDPEEGETTGGGTTGGEGDPELDPGDGEQTNP